MISHQTTFELSHNQLSIQHRNQTPKEEKSRGGQASNTRMSSRILLCDGPQRQSLRSLDNDIIRNLTNYWRRKIENSQGR